MGAATSAAAAGARAAGAALRHIVDFALPARCPACAAIVSDPHSFCLACWQSLSWLGEPCCIRCGLPFEFGQASERAECAACLADPPRFDRLRAAVAYGDVARKVALKLKYGGRPAVAETMARFMIRHQMAVEPGEGVESLIVPVPLHRWRIWKRGYNQAALIATALSRRSGIPAALDVIRRVRATPPLRGMNRRERALAVSGAFAIGEREKAKIAGKRIILIDDVFTSGATGEACARLLKRSGAAEVHMLCWARVIRSSAES